MPTIKMGFRYQVMAFTLGRSRFLMAFEEPAGRSSGGGTTRTLYEADRLTVGADFVSGTSVDPLQLPLHDRDGRSFPTLTNPLKVDFSCDGENQGNCAAVSLRILDSGDDHLLYSFSAYPRVFGVPVGKFRFVGTLGWLSADDRGVMGPATARMVRDNLLSRHPFGSEMESMHVL
jgi:hypothetical protein